MERFHRKHYKWLRHIPRQKHLKGGRLHKLLGEGLFAPALWKPTRKGIAGGLALGLFIGFTPTMGAQIFLAGIAAYVLKVNIPMALAGCLVTNPLTAAFIYTAEYQLGLKLVGLAEHSDLEGYQGAMRNLFRHAKPLWAGSLVTGGVVAAAVYGLINWFWVDRKPPLKVEDRS